jgi:hypothetical protein
MPTWNDENIDPRKLRHALENCYMLACRKRAVAYRYPEGKEPETIGPESTDEDWEHIKRFCEFVGLRPSVLRTV